MLRIVGMIMFLALVLPLLEGLFTGATWTRSRYSDASVAEVKSAFLAANIPEDATINFNPSLLLDVTFPRTSSPPILVKVGERLLRNDTALPPSFGINILESPGFESVFRDSFVIAMIDLDGPTPQAPTESQVRHILAGNFHVENIVADGVALLRNSTPAVSNYFQPEPPAGSDPHRYVFLLYKQPSGFNRQTDVNASTPITNFNISVFAEEVGLGSPLGGSFILVGPT